MPFFFWVLKEPSVHDIFRFVKVFFVCVFFNAAKVPPCFRFQFRSFSIYMTFLIGITGDTTALNPPVHGPAHTKVGDEGCSLQRSLINKCIFKNKYMFLHAQLLLC